jgi:hypothetical protein
MLSLRGLSMPILPQCQLLETSMGVNINRYAIEVNYALTRAETLKLDGIDAVASQPGSERTLEVPERRYRTVPGTRCCEACE